MAQPAALSGLLAHEVYDAAENCGVCWGESLPTSDVSVLMTKEEVEGVQELAALYEADGILGAAAPDELTLLRFMRARKMDTTAALKQLQSERLWRHNNDVDRLLHKKDPLHEIYTNVRVQTAVGFSTSKQPIPGLTSLADLRAHPRPHLFPPTLLPRCMHHTPDHAPRPPRILQDGHASLLRTIWARPFSISPPAEWVPWCRAAHMLVV